MKDITKQFVPFHLANRLKELGFNEPCLATHVGGQIYPVQQGGGSPRFELVSNQSLTIDVAVPTWSQAFDWVLANKQLLISFDVECDDDTIKDVFMIKDVAVIDGVCENEVFHYGKSGEFSGCIKTAALEKALFG